MQCLPEAFHIWETLGYIPIYGHKDTPTNYTAVQKFNLLFFLFQFSLQLKANKVLDFLYLNKKH